MTLIPNNQRIHTVSADVDTRNRKSALLNSNVESVTMADITQTVTEEGPIKYYMAQYTANGNQGTWAVTEFYNTTGITFTWSRYFRTIISSCCSITYYHRIKYGLRRHKNRWSK